MINKIEYKKLMLETSRKIGPIILKYLEPLKKESKELYEICSELPRKKIGTFETRAYLLRMAFEICSGKKWKKEVMYACAAVELELVSMYYSNRIFDEKGGEKILSQPKNQFIASMITRDLASQVLTMACKNYDYKTFIKIKDILDESNKDVYIGQFIDININLYKPGINLDFNKLLDSYYKRVYLMNDSFFEKIAIIGAILGNGTKKQIKALANFGKNYGTMLQIINDISDFVPPMFRLGTNEKTPLDAYSDVKNGKLTLPIIYTLTYGNNEEKKLIKSILGNKNVESKKLLELTKILLLNKSIKFSQQKAYEFAKKAKINLSIFPKKKRIYLEGMCFVAYTNKYYKALQKFKKSYLQ